MGETKIVVPDERINRVWSAVNPMRVTHEQIKTIVEAFAFDLSEHPIVPTDEQEKALCEWSEEYPDDNPFVEFQRRMFRAPDMEVTESERAIIDEWLRKHQPRGSRVSFVGDVMAQELLDSLEAYRRGQKSQTGR